MYFSLLPDIKYDKKPLQYPFSSSDYVVVKNFFQRYQINEDVFSYTVLFRKYAVPDGERLDELAEKAYQNPFYDWIIVLTNNMINPQFDWPMSEYELRKHVEKNYDDPYNTVHHYEIIDEQSQLDAFGTILYPPGTRVDETFYYRSHKYNDNGTVAEVLGSFVSYPVNVFEYESSENEKKREIFLLKPKYLDDFIDDFRRNSKYKKSSKFINSKLKEAGY